MNRFTRFVVRFIFISMHSSTPAYAAKYPNTKKNMESWYKMG